MVSTRKLALAHLLAVTLLLNLIGLAVPRLTQTILDGVVGAGDFSLLTGLLLALALVAGVQIALTIWRRLHFVRLSLDLDRQLLSGFCAHLFSLPAGFFRKQRVGDLLSRFRDHQHLRHLFTTSLTQGAVDSLMVGVYSAILFAYSPQLAALVLACVFLYAGFTGLSSPALKRNHLRLLQDQSAHEAQLVEALHNIDLVKATAIERVVHAQWEAAFDRCLASNYRTQKLRQILESVGSGIKLLCTAIVLGYGALLVGDGRLSAGELVAFSLYASQTVAPLLSLIALWDDVQQARVAHQRMQVVWDEEPEDPPAGSPRVVAERLRGHVRFEGVSFGYGDDPAEVLRAVSFEIRPGECVAVMGPSGSGKTTLARLLMGLYRPTRGRICIDAWDLAELDVTAYRRQVGVVVQENLLVAGTIAENIALGDENADRDRIEGAARRAGAHRFIRQLRQGYETPVGEMGLTLSGGQRQRISLARALYHDPRILILDEVTSALDRSSRHEVRDGLAASLVDRTTLLIAHDPTALDVADRVLLVRDGALVEVGAAELRSWRDFEGRSVNGRLLSVPES